MPVVRRANKGVRYPPDLPRIEEIIAVMRRAGETDHGLRLRALIVVLWRAGLRVSLKVSTASTSRRSSTPSTTGGPR
jgi:hypothetical protein